MNSNENEFNLLQMTRWDPKKYGKSGNDILNAPRTLRWRILVWSSSSSCIAFNILQQLWRQSTRHLIRPVAKHELFPYHRKLELAFGSPCWYSYDCKQQCRVKEKMLYLPARVLKDIAHDCVRHAAVVVAHSDVAAPNLVLLSYPSYLFH